MLAESTGKDTNRNYIKGRSFQNNTRKIVSNDASILLTRDVTFLSLFCYQLRGIAPLKTMALYTCSCSIPFLMT